MILIVKSFRLMNIRTKEERVYELTHVLPYLFSLCVPLFRSIHKDFFIKSTLLLVSCLLFYIFCLPLNGKSTGNRGKLSNSCGIRDSENESYPSALIVHNYQGQFPLLIVFWTELIPDVWALLYFQNRFFRYSKVICYCCFNICFQINIAQIVLIVMLLDSSVKASHERIKFFIHNLMYYRVSIF